jgi:hypothetical protein
MREVPSRGRMKEEAIVEPANLKAKGKWRYPSIARMIRWSQE